jgi:23S rRNA (pseudouridine1915-N3)-methyltransferase
MHLLIAAIGRLKDGPDRALLERYAERMNAAGRSLALGPLVIRELPESRAATAAARMRDEAARLSVAAAPADVRVALDTGGRQLSSEGFAAWLRTRRDAGCKSVAFLIGGADGHGTDALDPADLKLSLGPMTLPHGLARIVLAEQLYRAATIIAGHPYHRGG